ncbi:Cysteine proteinase inhibitor 1 [Linum grandiflorum]
MITIAITLSFAEEIPKGWQPIKDLNDKHVVEIAEFVVKIYNDEPHKKELNLVSVDKGEYRVVPGGTKYKLFLATTERHTKPEETQEYVAVVYENIFHLKNLLLLKKLK